MDVEYLTIWDPTKDSNSLTITAKARIKRELMNLYTEPPPGVFVLSDETNLRFIYAVLVGPMDTPYEGGFFYFMLKCPNDYPLQPPRVKLFTTDAGKVQFNPNMNKFGDIFISILGTQSELSWSPAQDLSILLITIWSLLTEKPYLNAPGVKTETLPGDAERYNEIITYQTLRVAVCGMVENECHLNIPPRLQDVIKGSFLNFYEQYMDVIKERMHLDGHTLMDPFSHEKVTLNYTQLKSRIEALHKKVQAELEMNS